MTKTIKEIIIMLLVCLVTMLVLAIVLYQYIPNRKAVPEITTYAATDDVKLLLEDDIDQRSDDDQVILTYEVTESDLNSYQNTNDYVPGKSNPFAAYSGTPTGEEATTDNTQEGTNTETSSSTGENRETSSPSVYSQNTGTK